MPAIINFKICSNGWQCNCPAVCPTGAFYYDRAEKTLKIDNAKCVGCGRCRRACPIAAVFVAWTRAGFNKIKAKIEADPRRPEDLRVEKLGADPIAPPLCSEQVQDFVAKNGGLVCLELKQDEADLACQLYSINISDIIDFEKIKYASVIDGEKIAKEYGIAARPALVFFRDGALIGKTEGYFESGGAEKELLKKKIKEIVE